LAFLEMPHGADAVLNLTAETRSLFEGAWIEVEVRSEPRPGKSASVRFHAPAEGRTRLLAPGPPLEALLQAFAPDAPIVGGAAARDMADIAQQDALETQFAIPGGGSIAVEPTRALVAVDIDLGAGEGATEKKAARSANLAAIAAAARVLRLKGLSGLVAIDLVGRGHDAASLINEARKEFAPDNPGVALGAISRFGVLELTVPRRLRPAIDILTEGAGTASARTEAFNLVRALEREAGADPGGRFIGLACSEIVAAAARPLARLQERVGRRVALSADASLGDFTFKVKAA
jgi:Ribonuclease G/E